MFKNQTANWLWFLHMFPNFPICLWLIAALESSRRYVDSSTDGVPSQPGPRCKTSDKKWQFQDLDKTFSNKYRSHDRHTAASLLLPTSKCEIGWWKMLTTQMINDNVLIYKSFCIINYDNSVWKFLTPAIQRLDAALPISSSQQLSKLTKFLCQVLE